MRKVGSHKVSDPGQKSMVEVSTISEETEYKVYGYRWVVTVVFGLILLVQAWLWISFAPIETQVQHALGLGTTAVRLLALVGPFMFIFVSTFAGSLSDNQGWKFSAGLGVAMLMVAGVVKAITPHVISSGTGQYWVFLFMQVLGGIGSAFALANLSKMPIKWYPEKQRALGNGLTTMMMYLGTAIGLPLVTIVAGVSKTAPQAVAQAGLNRVLLVVGIATVVAGVLFYVLAKEEPPTPAGPISEIENIPLKESFPILMRSTSFRALCVVSLAGYGIYIGLTVTMEKIMGFHGFSTSLASIVAAVITVGGIVGAGLLPPVSEKLGLRKPFLIVACAVAIPTTLIIAYVGNKTVDVSSGLLLGFFLLPALPITFTMVGEMSEIGPRLAATAVGTLLAVGSIGSTFVPLLMEVFKKTPLVKVDYRLGLIFLAVLGLAALLAVIFFVKETGPRSSRPTAKPEEEVTSAQLEA